MEKGSVVVEVGTVLFLHMEDKEDLKMVVDKVYIGIPKHGCYDMLVDYHDESDGGREETIPLTYFIELLKDGEMYLPHQKGFAKKIREISAKQRKKRQESLVEGMEFAKNISKIARKG